VERCQGSGCTNFSQIAQLGGGVTSYGDSGLSANTTYVYRVRAFNSVGNSSYSSTASAKTPQSSLPAAPSSLTATASADDKIKLSWKDNSSNESGFKIEQCKGSGCTNFTEIAQVDAGATSYSNKNLKSSTTYLYRVRAYNASGNSAYSNTASAKTLH
jgi:predicted phage tail protein